LVNALGGSATPISWGELYTALQQGVVDGAENNAPSFYLSRHYEVCRYYSLDEHTSVPDVLLISTHIWNSLTEQEQEWLDEAVMESYKYQKQLWKKSSADALDAVQKAGVEVSYPEKGPFQDKVRSMIEEYRDEPEVYSIIQEIRSIE
jgi:TRAP-type C4-dicarboxylate transport system substrate-binding protein